LTKIFPHKIFPRLFCTQPKLFPTSKQGTSKTDIYLLKKKKRKKKKEKATKGN